MAKILIAEDETAVREFLTRGLAAHGHEVKAVGYGMAALDALEEDAYDLLLSDIVMPELDGLGLALKVAKEWPGLPVVLMTGFADQRARARNLNALVRDVISKPFTLDDINRTVTKALRR